MSLSKTRFRKYGRRRNSVSNMSLDVETIVKWNEGVKLYDGGRYLDSINKFREIAEPSSKIWFDVGCALLSVGKLQDAIEAFSECVKKDEHLAVGYFQRGICCFMSGRYRDAISNWRLAREKLRGRSAINYSPVNLQHILYDCEIIYNHALSVWHLHDQSETAQLLQEGIQSRATDKHHLMFNVALNAIQRGVTFDLLELPTRAIFRPDKTWLANVNRKDYLGKSTVVATLYDDQNAGFSRRSAAIASQTPRLAPTSKQKGYRSRSLENLLDIGGSDKLAKTRSSKSNEDIIGEKKGTNVCVSVRQEQLEYLRQNVPQKAPPRPCVPSESQARRSDKLAQPNVPPKIQPPPRVPQGAQSRVPLQQPQVIVPPKFQAQPKVPPKIQPPPKTPKQTQAAFSEHQTQPMVQHRAQPYAQMQQTQPYVPRQAHPKVPHDFQVQPRVHTQPNVPYQGQPTVPPQQTISKTIRQQPTCVPTKTKSGIENEQVPLQTRGQVSTSGMMQQRLSSNTNQERQPFSDRLPRKSLGSTGDDHSAELANILQKRREKTEGNS